MRQYSLTQLAGTRRGCPAVIIGSGPSLLETPLELLGDHPDAVVLGINRMWKPELRGRLPRLDFLVWTDDKVAHDMRRDAPASYQRLAELGGIWTRWERNSGAVNCHEAFHHAPAVLDFCDTVNGGSGHERWPVAGMESPAFLRGELKIPYRDPKGRHHKPGLTVAGTTAVLALHLALVLGCDPLILVGVDGGSDAMDRRHFFEDTPDERQRHLASIVKNGSGEVAFSNSADRNFRAQLDGIHAEWSAVRTLVNASARSTLTTWRRMPFAAALELEASHG